MGLDWFKCDTDYADDDKICELAREWGSAEARAFWPQLLGFVSQYMLERTCRVTIVDGRAPDRTKGERSLVELARFVHGHPNVTRSRLDRCAEVGLISPEHWRNVRETIVERSGNDREAFHERSTNDPGTIVERSGSVREIFLPKMFERLNPRLKKSGKSPAKEQGEYKSIKSVREDREEGKAPALQLFALYNQHRGELPQARELTKERTRKIEARLKSHAGDVAGYLRDFEAGVKLAAESPFCLGKNDREWKLSFDFLIENDLNLVKLLEGKYGGKGNVGSGARREGHRAFQEPDYRAGDGQLFGPKEPEGGGPGV
jgi:hypothetical protein